MKVLRGCSMSYYYPMVQAILAGIRCAGEIQVIPDLVVLVDLVRVADLRESSTAKPTTLFPILTKQKLSMHQKNEILL